MLARWQTVIERWPISTSASGRWRVLMQSSQFWICGLAIQPGPSQISAFAGSGGFGDQSRRIGGELVAIDFDLALFADEDGAALRPVGELHPDLDAVGVPEGDLAVGAGRDGPDFDGPGLAGPERPLDLVQSVRAPVGHLAARVVAPLHPPELELGVEGAELGRAAPHVPIVARRDRLLRQAGVAAGARIVDAEHVFNFPRPPVRTKSQAVRFISMVRCWHAHLEHAVVLADGVDEGAALGDVRGKRLFGVDVLAGLAGEDAREDAAVLGQWPPRPRRASRR